VVLATALASCTALFGVDGPYRAESGDGGPLDATTDTAADAPVAPDGGDAGPIGETGPVEAGPIVSVVAGRFYSCALYAGGVAQCWGNNLDGEFGNGSAVSSSIPIPAMGTGLTALFGGQGETCAVAGDAGRCAGRGGSGQLDNGEVDAQAFVPVATTVLPAPPIAFASGQQFTCAIVAGGDVWCAGDANLGVLGNGSTTGVQTTPVKVDLGGAPAMALAGQWNHACALTTAGDVWCWGDDSAGQIGNGTTTDAGVATPVHVTLAAPAREIGVGELHTCAIVGPDTNDGVWCWGDNSHGQLGNGGGQSATPVQAQGVSRVRNLAVGGEHTCVVLANAGGVACWGKGGSGELGNNDNADQPTAVQVTGIGGAPAGLTAGGFHTCALVSSPNVLCWGANDFGQLGNDDPLGAQQNTPVPVHF
jgi:alpha-tubulin suppressor-like RCC1 family protein